MVTNPPCNVGDGGLISGEGTKIPYVMGIPSLQAATTSHWAQEPSHHNEGTP